MTIDRPLRWAIIGAGGMGRWHVNALLKRTDIQVVAACDVNPQALDALPEGVARFADWRPLVETVELDGASVILPHHLYPEVVCALLHRGVHVLKEKAFARSLEDAVTMCRAAKETGRQLVVAGQHKFKASFVATQEHLGELGDIFLTRASILYRSRAIVDEGRWGWRGTRRLSGGVAIVDSGWHILELVTLLRGVPDRVIASTGQMRVSAGEYDVDEQGALILEYPDGGIGVVLASFVTTPSEVRVTLHGKRATLDADLQAERVTLVRGAESQGVPLGEVTDPAVRMYDLFLESIATGQPSPGAWSQAVQVQRVIEAAYLSAARGSVPVALAEVPAALTPYPSPRGTRSGTAARGEGPEHL
ncbi:MAG: Gfo/Idh/MocA family oxidoreductase [Chloroflexi bacterium]|nr:Gfo/Idh/MocA family oxidoreductase [Chloroflexota bacterium]